MRKYISYLVMVLFLFSIINAKAQYTDVWHFGDSSALEFTDTGVVSLTNSAITAGEPTSSICDSLGNILFYTNGLKIWNRNDELMLNGDSLNVYEMFISIGTSISQGVLILPHSISSQIYYVITLDHIVYPMSSGLSYTVVDMKLDGGLGGVIPTLKNINLSLDTLDEQMTAIRHGNGRDWWLLLQGFNVLGEHLEFYEFLVSEEGISGPIIQDLGYDTMNLYVGEMVASPQGDIIAVGSRAVQLFDFDRCSGTVSKSRSVVVDSALTGYYGMEFSEDGSKLYASDFENVYQIDFTYQGSDTTVELIFHETWNNYSLGQMQRGPDGKIYIASFYNIWPNEITSPKNSNLSVINNPNLHGMASDFDTLSVHLFQRMTHGGLPNHVNYNLGPLIGSPCDTLNDPTSVAPQPSKPENLISVFPNPTSSGELFLDLTKITQKQTLRLTVTDMHGKLVLKQRLLPGGIESIDLSDLPDGLFIYRLITDNQLMSSGKLIKQ